MSNDTELHRHQCEARECLKHNKKWQDAHYAGVIVKRGQKAADVLFDEVRKQRKLKQSLEMEV